MENVKRQQQILDYLYQSHFASIDEIAKSIYVSSATVRRDVQKLEEKGFVKTVYGGIVLSEYSNEVVPVSMRDRENADLKEAIAHRAADLIQDNDTVIFDASSTVRRICRHIKNRKNLTVITNNLRICEELKDSNITVYCTGGKLLHYSSAYIGEFAKNTIRNLNADLMFFSARGISLNGKVTNSSTEEDIQRTMMENSAHVCLLADYSKVGKTYPFAICQLKEVHTVITDKPFPECLDHPNVIVAKH